MTSSESSQILTKTAAQLEELGNPFIGIQLTGGQKMFGRVSKFTNYTVYIEDGSGEVFDVPRRIIKRCVLLIRGGKYDE